MLLQNLPHSVLQGEIQFQIPIVGRDTPEYLSLLITLQDIGELY
jgi:hypothetical protein